MPLSGDVIGHKMAPTSTLSCPSEFVDYVEHNFSCMCRYLYFFHKEFIFLSSKRVVLFWSGHSHRNP